jgi:hypothetical protein
LAAAGPVAAGQGAVSATNGSFFALVAFTRDAEWKKKWNTPRANSPNFDATDTIHPGEKGALLVFFSNPTARDGKIAVYCDVSIADASGRELARQPATRCAPDELPGPATDIYLSMDIAFGANNRDPNQIITFKVGVEDRNASIRIPLEFRLEVKGK